MKRSWEASKEAFTNPPNANLEDCLTSRKHTKKVAIYSVDKSCRPEKGNTRSISPPPLTRKWNAPRHKSSTLSVHASLDSGEVRRSLALSPDLQQLEPDYVSQSPGHSFVSLTTPIPRHSNCDSKSAPPKMPRCRTCNKSSATRYDPMVTCSTCQRPYHDSCRMPALLDGVDPNTWKCRQCLGNRHKRKPITDTASQTAAAPWKPSVTRIDQPKAPKPTPIGTTQNILRRLPSFAALLRPATDSNAPEQLENNIPALSNDLHLESENKMLKGTFLRETVGHVDSSVESELQRNHLSEALTRLVLSNQVDDNGEVNRSIDVLSKPRDVSNQPELFRTSLDERPEVSDTLSQCSKQLDSPDLPTKSHNSVHNRTVGNSDTSLSVRYSMPERTDACMISCSKCGQHPAGRQSLKDLKCPGCGSQSVSIVTGLAIPETTNATSGISDGRPRSPKTAGCVPETTTPYLAIGLIPTAQSNSSSMCSKTKDMELDALSATPSTKCTDSFNDVLRGYQHDELTSNYLGEKSATSRAEVNNSIEPFSDSHSLDTSLANSKTTEDKAPAHTLTSYEDNRGASGNSPLRRLLSTRYDDASSMIDTDVEAREEPAVKSIVESSRPATTLSPVRSHSNASPPDEVSTDSTAIARNLSAPQPGKRFTNRELARIALAAASGLHLTTTEIVDWNLQMFPHLVGRKLALEKNIATVLSVFSEFSGQKIGQECGNKQLWGFANPEVQRQYEQKYAEYKLIVRGTNTVPKGHLVSTDNDAIPIEVELTLEMASPAGLKECDVPLLTTSGTSCSLQALNALSSNRARFSEESVDQTPSVETMTAMEIDRKISEIKQRPRRKRLFGSDHRLAHVRRYGRKDIHNESEETWKSVTSEKVRTATGDTVGIDLRHEEETTTLRELFSLPENAIPTNSGRAELAFCDGALVGGKLPRSRHTHKVGKMLGGELTIRTS